MPMYCFGGRQGSKQRLVVSPEHVAIRTHSRRRVRGERLTATARAALEEMEMVFRLPGAGVEVHRVRRRQGKIAMRDHARHCMKGETDVHFAGRVLRDPKGKVPVLYTENLFVQFAPERGNRFCRRQLRERGLVIKRAIPYLRNAFFASVKEGMGQMVFEAAEDLLGEPTVVYCHPELVKEPSLRESFPEQWHLFKTRVRNRVVDAHAHVVDAWSRSEGEGVTIAVIDDGFDLRHEEFRSTGKIVEPRDVTGDSDDPSPRGNENHGTACAGVACGNGLHGASGVAPRARLMPIRMNSGVGSQDEADAIQWAAEKGADVISCSWGPKDGKWNVPEDPGHTTAHPLPDSTRLAIDWALEHGRGGRGCVITWAAGNGNESVDLDGYASYEKVIAVAACNDRGKRSSYSDFGKAIWCCFPSNELPHSDLTDGVWTTDRSGSDGWNTRLLTMGDRRGNYYSRFGGTSSACPGVAGVAALMLAVNPELPAAEVKELLKATCDPIDRQPDDPKGAYDANGHSDWYGYGRVHAAAAVQAAADARPAAAEAVEAGARRRGAVPAAAPAAAPAALLDVEVRLETEAANVALWLDGEPLPLVEGRARTRLGPDVTYALGWWVAGEPETPYGISLSVGGAEIDGALPVERRIARDRTKSAGTRLFRIAGAS